MDFSLMQYISAFSPSVCYIWTNKGAVQKFYENIDIDSTSPDEKLTRPEDVHFEIDFPKSGMILYKESWWFSVNSKFVPAQPRLCNYWQETPLRRKKEQLFDPNTIN